MEGKHQSVSRSSNEIVSPVKAVQKPLMKVTIKKEIGLKAKDYVIRPRSIFRNPLGHIHSDQFKEKDHKNFEITTHCNYGFNYDTIKVYASLLNRFLRAYEIVGSERTYSNSQCGLMRLNDEIPIDFGGFSPVLNYNLLDVSSNDNFWTGDSLFEYFIELCCNMSSFSAFPLLEFVRRVNDVENSGELGVITKTIVSRIEDYFHESMEAIRDRNRQLGLQQGSTGGHLDSESSSNDNFYSTLFSRLLQKKDQPKIEESRGSSSQNSHDSYIGKRERSCSEESEERPSKAFIGKNGSLIKKRKQSQEKKVKKQEEQSGESREQEVERKESKKRKHKKKIRKNKHGRRHQKHKSKKDKRRKYRK